MPRTMPRRLTPLRLTGFAIGALALLGTPSLALADKVGTAAAVQPDAFTNGTEMKIGNSIFFNQRINTTGKGLVQVLLVDGSTFTVGPGSDLVIDKFVYDPTKNTGQVVATLGKGVLRFVGGKISKNVGGVTVNTPTGALAIRGGMFQGKVDSHGSVFSFLFGVEMKFTGADGDVHRVYEPGYTLDFTGGGPTIRPTLPADTAFFMKALSGGGQVVTGGNNINNKDSPAPAAGNTSKPNTSEITQGGSADVVQSNLQNQQNQPNPPPPQTPPPPQQVTLRVLTTPQTYTTAFPDTPQFTTTSAGGKGILGGDANPAVTVDDFNWPFSIANGRIVGTVSGLDTSYQNCSGDPSSCQTLFKTINPHVIDFPAPGTGTCTNGVCQVTVTDAATITGIDDNGNQVNQVPTTKTLIGTAVVEPGFFAYQLINSSWTNNGTNNNNGNNNGPDPVLAFGGTAFNIGQSGKLYLFNLTPDVFQVSQGGAIGPFASAGSSPYVDPNKPQPSVSPLEMLTNDAAKPGSGTVWLQTSLYINTSPADANKGTPFDQQSFVNVALGGTDPNTGGLVGARRGGANVDVSYQNNCNPCNGPPTPTTTREALAFTGDIATLAGPPPNGSSVGPTFMGTANPNMVIGIDSTGTHNIGRDIPLFNPDSAAQNSGATYHVGIGALAPTVGTQTGGTVNGYAAGVINLSPGSLQGNDSPVNGLASQSSNDVTISFDATSNTLSATLVTHVLKGGGQDPGQPCVGVGCSGNQNKGGMTLVLGDPSNGTSSGRSAFIDNQHYAAIETPTQTTIQSGDGNNTLIGQPTGYLVSGDQLGVTKFFPETFGQPIAGNAPAFCDSCEFLKWGAWGARAGFQNSNTGSNGNVIPGNNVTVDVHLGWWVAGDVVSQGDLDALQTQPTTNSTASYSGHAIGTVANGLNGPIVTYVATGNMGMNWDFGSRTGDLTISKFDTSVTPGGLTFSGPMCAPGVTCGTGNNQFTTPAGNHFGGPLSVPTANATGLPTNLSSLTGSAIGSFVGPTSLPNPSGPGVIPGIPQGVIGNWNIGNGQGNNSFTYGATGIFAGSHSH